MAKTNYNNLFYIFYDLETGGLKKEKNPIVEICMIPVIWLYNKKELLVLTEFTLNEYVKPYKDLVLEDNALKISNIKKEDVLKYGLDQKEIYKKILSLVELVKDSYSELEYIKPQLAGHNINDFDNGFLEVLFNMNNDSIYNLFKNGSLDTLDISRIMFADNNIISSRKLETISNFIGIKVAESHRAKTDVMKNIYLFIKIMKLLNFESRREVLEM